MKSWDYMIHSVKFSCLIDTNILYPFHTRDIMLWFAHFELYTPKWSQHIFEEWENVMRNKNIDDFEIKKRIENVTLAFPEALVKNYELLIDSINLPDLKDRHVLAAAIKSNSQVIVTNNLKDFPRKYLESFNISAKSADDFLTDLIDLNHEIAIEAFKMMVLHKKNPDLDEYQMLDIFRKYDLKQTADYLHALI